MSDFGTFEAAAVADQEPRRKQRIAARQMAAALSDIHDTFGTFMANADGADNFEDRWSTVRADVRKTLLAHQIGTYPAVMREAYGHLKKSWIAVQAAEDTDDENESDPDDGFGGKKAPPFGSKEKDARRRKADLPGQGVDTSAIGGGASGIGGMPGFNMGQPSAPATDAPGMGGSAPYDGANAIGGGVTGGGAMGGAAPGGGGAPVPAQRGASRRVAEDRSAPFQDLPQGRPHGEGDLIPQEHNDPANSQTPAVQNDFIPPTSDIEHREAMQLVADLYTDWADSNRLRVASMNTLDVYASNGLHDDDYFLLAGMIRKAECDCDDDEGEDHDDSEGGSEPSDDSGSEDGDGDDDSSDESDSGDNPFTSEGGDDSDDEGDDGGGSEDGGEDFYGGDDAADAGPEDGGSEDFGAEDDGGDQDFGGDPDPDGSDPAQVGDPSADPASADQGGPVDDGSGQQFTVPEEAPDLPPEAMDQIPQDDTAGDQSIPPEVIDQILGLPPGTLEALIVQELQGGGADQGGPPPGGPPPQLASRRRAAEDPTQAAGGSPSAAPAAPAQMPAAPPAGAGSAATMAPPGSGSVAPPPAPMPLENQPAEDALLDTALQSVTQMIDTETQEYQQIIDPLTQALQAIEFAQQVEQAENPLDVTPPEGSVNASPAAAPGGSESTTEKAAAIANRYQLSEEGYGMLIDAMSRKHYEHVGEAIRSLPEELRPGIANHIGAMFKEDNSRFNHDQWLNSVGARSFMAAGAGNTPTLDTFEFPGTTPTGKPVQTKQVTPYAVDDLGKGPNKISKGVLPKFQDFTKKRTDMGLNNGDLGNESAFETENQGKLGPKAIDKVRSTVGAPPAAPAAAATTKTPKQASFFTRRVPGWKWDDHLAGYISREARNFTCSCGNEIPTPSYGTCRCGKLWNSYAIGDGHHLAGNSADMFVTREIPVREDVIVANKRMAWTSDNGWTPPDQRDIDWVEDEDREDADAPHAPGKTAAQALAWDAAEVRVANLVGLPVRIASNPAIEGVVTHTDLDTGSAWVQHAGGHHQFALADLQSAPAPSLRDAVRQHVVGRIGERASAARSAFFAEGALREDDYITKYDDDEDPARKDGPKKPPSTTIKGGDPKWHSRQDGGKFKSTSPFKG